MAAAFIDANVLLRHVTADHPVHSPRATEFLREVESGDTRVYLSDFVVSEIVYTLSTVYKHSKRDIRDTVIQLLQLRGVSVDDRTRLQRALNLFADVNLPFVDAYLASRMLGEGADAIVSFDRDFDRIPGITRIEP